MNIDIDYDLLREQQETLLNIITNHVGGMTNYVEHLDGLVCLIDVLLESEEA